jgi:hypothetical protein
MIPSEISFPLPPLLDLELPISGADTLDRPPCPTTRAQRNLSNIISLFWQPVEVYVPVLRNTAKPENVL